MWIIVWREHGIYGKAYMDGFFGFSATTEVRELFKARLNILAQQYPNLTIIAGTLLTKNFSESLDKLDEIETYYKKQAWVKNEEKNVDNKNEFGLEENKIALLKKQAPLVEYAFFRNTCYIFHGNEIGMRDKIAPFEETQTSYSQLIFQPGNKKTISSHFKITHPTTNATICFGVEICREHLFAVLKRTSKKPCLIHFLLSDTACLNVHHAHGDYVLQLDSTYIPKLIYLGNINDANHAGPVSIVLYQHNLANPDDNILQGPFEPIYPFEKKVVDVLDHFLRHHVGDKYSTILELKNKFIKHSGLCDETNTYHRF